jgi:hypothetical protein
MLQDNPPEAFREGFQDFNKVEPYAVCLAGKPVKQFDYYEDARRFHDNWKKKLYREGNTEKADKITLMPLNLDEAVDQARALKAAQQAAKFMIRNLDDRAALKDYSMHFWSPERFYQGATMAMRGVGYDEIVKHITQDEPAWFPKPQYEAANPAQQAAIAIAKKKEQGVDEVKQRLDAKCWKGKHKEGTKIKGGIRVNNCVPNESVENHYDQGEYNDEAGMAQGNLYTIAKAAKGLLDTINDRDNLPEWVQEKIAKVEGMMVSVWDYLQSQKAQGIDPQVSELAEEFDLIESIIEELAERNRVDSEVIWEDLESLTDDELYVFATTTPVMEDWQKVNKKDKTDGMSRKAVKAYRREHPGSKLKTAVTTKPSKLKKGGKASKRRKSYCSRSKGQMKMHNISCAKTPDKAICKARRRWNCQESYWNKLQDERSTKLNNLVNELKESIEK